MLAVSDGMGGHPAGERAASLVLAACEVHPEPGADPVSWLRERIEAARAAIAADEHVTQDRAGMGATVVLTLLRGDVVWFAHAGDSRAYAWSSTGLERLTEDHNAAAESVRKGTLTPEAAMHDPGRHRLTRVVMGRAARPEVAGPRTFERGGVILLVSDGVTGTTGDGELASLVASYCGRRLADMLIEAAYERGAPDNIAIALADSRC